MSGRGARDGVDRAEVEVAEEEEEEEDGAGGEAGRRVWSRGTTVDEPAEADEGRANVVDAVE